MARYTEQDLIKFEQRIIDNYNNNKLPFLFHLCGGNEQQLINIFEEINDGDWVLATHRNHYQAYLHGIPPETVEDRVMNGRSMFIYDNKRNFFSSAIVGGIPGIAVGIAMALKRKGSDKKVWCFVGDGAEDTGHFSESVRYVDGWDLPCTFVVEDNDMSIIANKKERWGKAKIPKWPNCVRRYQYTLPFPHARTKDFCDLSITNKIKKADEEYFPHLPVKELPDYLPSLPFTSDMSYKDAITQAVDRCNSYEADYNDPPLCVVTKVGDKHLTYQEQADWMQKIYGRTTLAAKLIGKKKIEKKKKEKKTEKTKTTSSSLSEELKELNKLYEDGVLTKEEFEKAKKKLLN